MSDTPSKNSVLAALEPVWAQRTPREKQLLRLAGVVLVLAAMWQLALAPAWRTWQTAPAQQARLDAQTQTMRQLQAQAKKLQAPNPISKNESVQWLEKNLAELGPGAKLNLQGERATLTVEAAPPEALARWMGLARERALAMPIQAQLQQGAAPAQPASANKPTQTTTQPANDPVLLRGSLVLRLP